MVSWKLVGIGLVPLAGGAGIVYPVINSFNSNVSIKFENLGDFKRHCLISISGGGKGHSGETYKKLLVCPVSYNTSEATFYLYNDSSSEKDKLPREIESLERESAVNEENIKLSLKNNAGGIDSEIISVNNLNWRKFYDSKRDLKQDCTVDWKESKKIYCSGQVIPPELTEFN